MLIEDYLRWERTNYGANHLGTVPCPVCRAEPKLHTVRVDKSGFAFRRFFPVHSVKRHREAHCPIIGASTHTHQQHADGTVTYRLNGCYQSPHERTNTYTKPDVPALREALVGPSGEVSGV